MALAWLLGGWCVARGQVRQVSLGVGFAGGRAHLDSSSSLDLA